MERKSREVVSVGLRSCPSIARFSRILNCVHQLQGIHTDTYQCEGTQDTALPAEPRLVAMAHKPVRKLVT